MFDKLIDFVRSMGAAALPFQIVGADRSAILLRLGRYRRPVEPGLILKIPFADTVMSCDSRTHFYRTAEQSLITRDGQQVIVSALISFRVSCPKTAILSQTEFGCSVWDGTAATLSRLVSETLFDDMAGAGFAEALKASASEEGAAYGTQILTCRLENLARARTFRIVK